MSFCSFHCLALSMKDVTARTASQTTTAGAPLGAHIER